jgi:hypothetical protein
VDWGIYQNRIRFDIRAEREEYERLFCHQARVLQDRLARRGRTDRTKKHAMTEWEKYYQAVALESRLLHQARVLSWGKEKRHYYAFKAA